MSLPYLSGRSFQRLTLATSAILFCVAPLQAQSWYNTSWTNRKPITIDRTKVSGGSALSNFPVLFSVTDANLKTVANGGSVGKADGTDILFTASDGTTKLDHEIESYTATTGKLAAWVRIPTLSTTVDTVIYVYYGNASAADQQNITGAWDSNFKGVWHLPNGTTLSAVNSISNTSGTINGPMATSGQIEGGGNFVRASSQYIDVGNGTPLQITGSITLSCWVKLTTNGIIQSPVGKWDSTRASGDKFAYSIIIGNANKAGMYLSSDGSNLTGSAVTATSLSVGTWYHISAVYNGTNIQTYLNGAADGSAVAYAGGIKNIGAPAVIGRSISSLGLLYLNGALDEVHISNTSRSAGWITTEYTNQNSPSTFYSVGGQQSSGGSVTTTITTAPSGLSLTVDSVACTAPCAFQWTSGSSHTIAVTTTPQSGPTGTRYVYASWSDSGAQSHSITAPSSATTYTATFTTQYQLTTSSNPAPGGIITPATTWLNAGTVQAVSAAANSGYQFSGFTGALSGTTNPQNLTMNAAATVTANFSVVSVSDVSTDYTYNLLDQLTTVTMTRPTGTQTRTFVYDPVTRRLTSASNPENGTVTYTYGANGKIASRTDAKNQKVIYTYNTNQVLAQIQRYPVSGGAEDTCQRTEFYYDTNPYDSQFSQYSYNRLKAAKWGGAGCSTPYEFRELYSYTPGGLVTKKRLMAVGAQPLTVETQQSYDTEGRVIDVKYPDSWKNTNGGLPFQFQTGATYGYSYDAMGRPVGITEYQPTATVVWAKEAQYGPAGELKQMKYRNMASGFPSMDFYTETRTYNNRVQLTRLTVNIPSELNVMDLEYRYSATQNNGQITQQKDWLSGEEVNYQYDGLQRLISAATTGPEWGQSFSYDGFGNRTAANVTKGTAPSSSFSIDAATNRITNAGFSYDANGNMYAGGGLTTAAYDIENRMGSATTASGVEQYAYGLTNKRIWKKRPNGDEEVYFYGIGGQKLVTYTKTAFYNTWEVMGGTNLYFGSKKIRSQFVAPNIPPENQNGTTMAVDRLGSWGQYYPYGEEKQVSAQDRDKFATYYRDNTGLDYADQRYYGNTLGRFTSPDPYNASGGPSNPNSWNRYAYVEGDPVNHTDRHGTCIDSPIQFEDILVDDVLLDLLPGGSGPDCRPQPRPGFWETIEPSYCAFEGSFVANTSGSCSITIALLLAAQQTQKARIPHCDQWLFNAFKLDYSQLLFKNKTQSTKDHIIERHMNGTTSGTSQYYQTYFWQVELINVDTFLFGNQTYDPNRNTINFTWTYPDLDFGLARMSYSIGTDASGAKTGTNLLVLQTDCTTVITSYPVPK